MNVNNTKLTTHTFLSNKKANLAAIRFSTQITFKNSDKNVNVNNIRTIVIHIEEILKHYSHEKSLKLLLLLNENVFNDNLKFKYLFEFFNIICEIINDNAIYLNIILLTNDILNFIHCNFSQNASDLEKTIENEIKSIIHIVYTRFDFNNLAINSNHNVNIDCIENIISRWKNKAYFGYNVNANNANANANANNANANANVNANEQENHFLSTSLHSAKQEKFTNTDSLLSYGTCELFKAFNENSDSNEMEVENNIKKLINNVNSIKDIQKEIDIFESSNKWALEAENSLALFYACGEKPLYTYYGYSPELDTKFENYAKLTSIDLRESLLDSSSTSPKFYAPPDQY